MTSTAGCRCPRTSTYRSARWVEHRRDGQRDAEERVEKEPQMTAKMPPIANTPASAPRPPFLPLFLYLSQRPPSIMRSP